jgi:preprotein translocase subunit SecA
MDSMLQRLGLKDGEAIVHPWINKALERAQQKVEARNFDIRKNILKYDDVMNDQRKVVFEQRLEFMEAESVDDTITMMRHQTIDELIETHIPPKAYAEQWDMDGLDEAVKDVFALDLPVHEWAAEEGIADEEISERLYDASDRFMAARAVELGPDIIRQVEKSILLQTLDQHWREHLLTLEHLRQIVGLRGIGQRDPLAEFKLEAFTLFSELLAGLRRDVIRYLSRVQVETRPPELAVPEMTDPQLGPQFDPQGSDEAGAAGDIDFSKTGRNQPCPCGSGKKFKHCHGAVR